MPTYPRFDQSKPFARQFGDAVGNKCFLQNGFYYDREFNPVGRYDPERGDLPLNVMTGSPKPGTLPSKPELQPLPSPGGNGGDTVAGDTLAGEAAPPPDLPADWRNLAFLEMKMLAKAHGMEVSTQTKRIELIAFLEDVETTLAQQT
jgi:hypothetical protein